MRDRRLLIPPSLGVACSGQKVPKAVLWSSTPMSCCSLLRHLPPALERLSKRKGIVIVALTNCYLTVSYITLSFLWPFPFPGRFTTDDDYPVDFGFCLSIVGYTSQIMAGGLALDLHRAYPQNTRPLHGNGDPGGQPVTLSSSRI